ncbi:alpha/beta hydrolase [Ornithinimicrobium pratense]|uniref:Alpha/beta hydrolase n=1 Tax=Ornithinimicrobium pratense TaxID=2593973 RepID=A0A5J6V6G6_9MICO|nr:alpha/beta hydrolase [Ornithinimicrobium pratense]QFG68633.1 alpha/beta hydrolase [Ornithinimicrobium pratense]
MDLRDLTPPVKDGPFPPAAYLPPITRARVRGAMSLSGLTYGVVRGFRPLVLDLHIPEGAEAPVPVVVWIHGGGWMEGDRRQVPLQWGQQVVFDTVVAAGMAVATVDYRLLGEAPFPACVHDCVAAVRYLRHFADDLGLDPDRIGLWGESAGAHLASMVAFLGSRGEADPRLLGSVGVADGRVDSQAVVLFYGAESLEALVGDHDFGPAPFGDNPAMVRAMAPIEHVHDGIPPVLLMHGDRDGIVDAEHSRRLHAALRDAGVDSTMEITPGADHCFLGTPIQPHLDRAVDFLAGHLL